MTTEVEIGLFYINICINDDCQLVAYEKLKSIQSPQAMRNISIMQLVNKVQGQYIILSYIVSFLMITMCSEFKIINSFVFFLFYIKVIIVLVNNATVFLEIFQYVCTCIFFWQLPFNFILTVELVEFQMESIIALVLCTISGMLVMNPAPSKPSRYRITLILMSIAGNTLKCLLQFNSIIC